MPRRTRNSQETAPLVAGQAPNEEANVASVNEAPAVIAPQSSEQPSPEFLATVIAAVKSAFQQEAGPPRSGSTPVNQSTLAPSLATATVSDASLEAQANSLHSAGAPPSFAGPCSSSSNQDSQGTSSSFVPDFVSTFSHSMSTSPEFGSNRPLASSHSISRNPNRAVVSGANIPVSLESPLHFQQPFIVGPGYSPVSFKLVTQVLAGKFVDLAELLSSNGNEYETEPQVLFDGRLVFSAPPKKNSIYTMIVCSRFPNDWRDLTNYKLLILRTYRQYAGRVWLSYDTSFRDHSAAIKLVDWSQIDFQLFNVHAAGATAGSSASFRNPMDEEPPGNQCSAV